MKKQTKKTKTTKTKAKTLTQRIEALRLLKFKRQKLTGKIEAMEKKLVDEVEEKKSQIQEEPKKSNAQWDNFSWRFFIPIKGCECERCTEYRVRFGNKTQE